MIYTYKLFKAFPPYFTGSDICLAFVNKAQWLNAAQSLKENTSTSWSDRNTDSMLLGGEHKTKLNYSMYQTKFDAKMTKMKWNYMANMIMSVSGTVCYLILYFAVKQRLAINLPGPARKNK